MQVDSSPVGEQAPSRVATGGDGVSRSAGSALHGAESQRRCPACLAVFRTGYERCPADGAELVALDGDPLLGAELAGRYVLEELVGQGSMGLIYRARHVALPRRFAVKILFGDLVVDPRMRIRFAQEAALASRLSHPNVVPVVDFGRTGSGLLYLVMDFVEGEGLGEVLAREGPLEARAALRLARQLAHGLGHAHRRGLVHRDFKPGNVLLEPQEDGALVPRILDFGLAISTRDRDENPCRLTELGLVIGTPIYIAPEQVLDLEVDHRADLFALGVVLYEMLAGRPPFDGRPVEIAHKNVLHPVPPIAARSPGVDAPAALEAVAARLLAKSPADRFGSADELAQALDAVEVELARRGRRARTMSVPSVDEGAPSARLTAAEAVGSPVAGDDRLARPSHGLVVLPPRAEPAPGLDSLTGQERIAPVGGTRRRRGAARGSLRRGLAVGGALLFAGAVGFYASASRPAPASARSVAPVPAVAAGEAALPGAVETAQPARPLHPASRPPGTALALAGHAAVDGDEADAAIPPESVVAAVTDAVGRVPAAARSTTASAPRAPTRAPASSAAAPERRTSAASAAATSTGAAAPALDPSPGASAGGAPSDRGPAAVTAPGPAVIAAHSTAASSTAASSATTAARDAASLPPGAAPGAAHGAPGVAPRDPIGSAPPAPPPRSITARVAAAAAPAAPRPREPIAVPPGRAHRVRGSLPAIAFPRWEQAPGSIAARLCVDESGAVTRVAVVSPVSSGVRAALERGMATWRYRPILDGGRPVPACFATRFRVQVE